MVKGSDAHSPDVEVNGNTRPFLLSPLHFGWPMHRPRLFSLGTRKGVCYFDENAGMQKLNCLFEKHNMDCSVFYCAPTASGQIGSAG